MKTSTSPYLPTLLVVVCVCLAPHTVTCCDVTISPSEGVGGIKDAVEGWSSSSLLVCLEEGTYSATSSSDGGINPDSLTGSLTIRGAGKSKTTIHMKGYGRFVYCGSGSVLFLEDVSITGCDLSPIHIYNARVEIENVIFENNDVGGSGSSAGGISAAWGDVQVTNCQFVGNSGSDAGAIMARDSAMSISRCLFENNHSSNKGGAVTAEDTSVDFYNCVIQNNEAGSDGGGVYSNGGYMNIYDGLVYRNDPNGVVCVSNVQCRVNDGVIANHPGAGLAIESTDIEISLYRSALCGNGVNLDCHSLHDDCEYEEDPCEGTLDKIDVQYDTAYDGCSCDSDSVTEGQQMSVVAVAIIVPISLVVVVGCTGLAAVLVANSRNNNDVEDGTNNTTRPTPTTKDRDWPQAMIFGAGNGVEYKPRRQSNKRRSSTTTSSTSASTNSSSSSSVSTSSSSESGSESVTGSGSGSGSESDPYVDGAPPPSYQSVVKADKESDKK